MRRFLKTLLKISRFVPDLSVLFVVATFAVILLSFVLSFFHVSAVNPLSAETVSVRNLLNKEDIFSLISRLGKNFLDFPPLAAVFLITMSVGVLEGSGFLQAALKQSVILIPERFSAPFLAAFSIFLHVTSYAAYVFLIPMAGMFFYLRGRHPIAGVVMSFAGVAGGFVASFTPTMSDPLMQALTEKAAKLFDASYEISVLSGYFYGFFTAVGLVFVLWLFNDCFMEKMLWKWIPIQKVEEEISPVGLVEKKGLLFASISIFSMLFLFIFVSFWFPSFLHDEKGYFLAKGSLFVTFIIPLLALFLGFPGIVFGFSTGVFRSSKNVVAAMSKAVSKISGFLVFIFFLVQFLDVLKSSNLILLSALWISSILKIFSYSAFILLLCFLLLTIVFNLLVPSEIAKWSVLSSLTVPVFMQLGIAPELTQVVYRIGDSSANVITPLFAFYPFVLEQCRRYAPNLQTGELLGLMLPYSFLLSASMLVFLVLFWILDVPIGVGGRFTYP